MDVLKQIEELAKSARALWFGLLAVLAFVGVVLLAHQDKDFFSPGPGTPLPLIGISVPTTSFFVFAPVLVAVVVIHFHLTLAVLWEKLGALPSLINLKTTRSAIYPTLLTRAAMSYKDKSTQGLATHRQPFQHSISLTVFLTTWLLGPAVLVALWVRSWALHNEWLTLWIAAWVFLTYLVVANGREHFRSSLSTNFSPNTHRRYISIGAKTIIACVLVSVSWLTTEGGLEHYWKRYKLEEATGYPPLFTTEDLSIQLPEFLQGENAFVSSNTYFFLRYADTFNPLYRANLTEAQISIRPANWEAREAWLSDQEVEFRKRLGISETDREKWTEDQRKAFAEYVRRKREARGDGLQKVSLIGADLRRARGARAFLAGVDLRNAKLDFSAFDDAVFVDTDMRSVSANKAYFWEIDLSGADLRNAEIQGTDLRGASLRGADMRGSDFDFSELLDADFFQTNVRASNLKTFDFVGRSQLLGAFGGPDTELIDLNQLAPCHWVEENWKGNIRYQDPDPLYDEWISNGAPVMEPPQSGNCN